MKIQFKRDIEIETASGPHWFESGAIVTVDPEDAYQLVKAGYAVPRHSLGITRKLTLIRPEDVKRLNEITALFDGTIRDIKRRPQPFDVTKCTLQPAPYGECYQFRMRLDKSDMTLSPYCKRAGAFCPHAESRKREEVKEGLSSTAAQKKNRP